MNSVSVFLDHLFLCLPIKFIVPQRRHTNQLFSFSPAQDQVPEPDRLVVGGVQNSVQSFMDLLGYVMGIIISNPRVIILGPYIFQALNFPVSLDI